VTGMKRESGRTGDVEAGSIRSCPRNCSGESFFRFPLGLVNQGLGRRRRVATREPGDLPERSHLPVRGVRARGGLPLW
jgi:hypothetical protein